MYYLLSAPKAIKNQWHTGCNKVSVIPGEKDKAHNEDDSGNYNPEKSVNNEFKQGNKKEIENDEEQPENGLDIESIIMG